MERKKERRHRKAKIWADGQKKERRNPKANIWTMLKEIGEYLNFLDTMLQRGYVYIEMVMQHVFSELINAAKCGRRGKAEHGN